MKQPVKNRKQTQKKRKTVKGKVRKKEFGTSKLEAYFADEFLDSNGIRYIYQYKAEGLGRYFDFAVTADNDYPYEEVVVEGVRSIKQGRQPFKVDFLIEVDGDYYHANPARVDERKLNPMQKHNRMVDGIKDRWCALNSIPLLRVWEHDIRNNPKKVMEQLSAFRKVAGVKQDRRGWRQRPH